MRVVASLPSTCAACRSRGALEVSQGLARGQLTWTERFSCACGHGFEAKNVGLPTPAAREALMARHGRFRVEVQSVPPSGKAWAVLAKVLDAPEAEVRRELGALPSQVWEGTGPEADFMRQALERSGATVRVEATPSRPPVARPSAGRRRR
ncbi:MAG: hypothetical protein SFW67_33040 [Myxococcaceae bacterium]|nr:hypothetical protein [Myxococcaceae bacterium]